MKNKLNNNFLFKGVSDEKIEEIFSYIKYSEVSYNKGQILFQEGDACKNIGIIEAGSIQLERIYSSGKSIVLAKLSAGDVFGEALVISSTALYPATVIAKSNCKIIFINKKEIMKLCSSNERILENFVTLLSDKVIMLNKKVKSTSLKSVKHKVVDYILEKSNVANSNVIMINESKEDIAAYLGIPRPSLSRELIKLRDENIIDFDRNSITILKFHELEEKLFD
ncbi:Crp/Fnr family transcriptional regulator [Clostridium sp. NSJ-6]|uniref:Crp/Fnr family transcriptional regulator n=1 Tax=Clostridium hominis TaxID=2763036 RepID=A0ABR7D8V1_9CLOT|nr:Crp/Fnr family transcriptional regulator [Clostridium hominis]MBC5627821.1 Crp/Fnr family transcriptional regulator [Clostridium hominis]